MQQLKPLLWVLVLPAVAAIGVAADFLPTVAGLAARPQPDHVNAGFVSVLGPVLLAATLAYLLEMRLQPIAGEGPDIEGLERDRRKALLSFAGGSLVSVVLLALAIIPMSTVHDEHFEAPEVVAYLVAPGLVATPFMLVLIVAMALLPALELEAPTVQRKRFPIVRGFIRRVLVTIESVLVGGALAILVGSAWLLSEWASWFVCAGLALYAVRTRRAPPPTSGRSPIAVRHFLALASTGIAAITAAALTLPAPSGTSADAVASYGFAAGTLATLLVLFAAGHPSSRTVERAESPAVARWAAAAATGGVGCLASLWGASASGGAFAFWGSVVGFGALAVALFAHRSRLLDRWA